MVKSSEKTTTFEELLFILNDLLRQKQKSRILLTNHRVIDMKAAKLIEKLNDLQVQVEPITLYLNMDCDHWGNLERRKSNFSESTLSTDITDFSGMSASTSHSSLASADITDDCQDVNTDECFSAFKTEILFYDASFKRVIQYSADLEMIKTELYKILNIDMLHLMQLTDTYRTTQVYQMLYDLIKVCMDADMELGVFQHQPLFIQMVYDTASRAVQASKEAFTKTLTVCHEQDNFKSEDLHKLSFSVNETLKFVSYYSQLQQDNKTVADQILDVGFRMVKFCYDRVEFASQQVDSLRHIIQEGIQQLNAIQISQQEEVLDSMFKVQDIFSSVHSCVLEKVQPLVSNFTSSFENDYYNQYSVAHGLIQHLIDSVFKDLDIFKSTFYSTVHAIQNIDTRANFKEKVEGSIKYIHQLNIDICNFTMMEVLWSVDTTKKQTTDMQDQLDDFQARHMEFILKKYNEICCHFTEYDNGLNYQKLGDPDLNQDYTSFNELQSHLDRAGVLLNYADQILQQRKAASHFMNHAYLLQARNQLLDETVFFDFNKKFKAVVYPLLDIKGLYDQLYYYQQDVYLTLSQMYIDTVNLCFKK